MSVLTTRNNRRFATRRRVLAVFAALLAFPALLFAHAHLVRSEPGDGTTISASPAELRLEFSERPELAFTRVMIVSAGDTVSLNAIRADPANPHIIIALVPAPLGSGLHTVLWRVAARDGHPVRGSISFTVAASTPTVVGLPDPAPMSPSAETQDNDGSIAVAGALGGIIVRWIGFISMFTLIGVVIFQRFVLDRKTTTPGTFSLIASTNAATLGLAASAGIVLTAALKLARESSDMPDASVPAILFGSSWGASLLVQILAALGAAAALKAAHSSREEIPRLAWPAAFACAMLVGITPAFGGHAIAGEQPWLAVPADIIHVLAGSAWLGTLTVIAIVAIPAALKSPDEIRPGARVASLINSFSPLALICGGAVVATGIGASVIRLPRVNALWTTPYGVILVLKLVFVALLFGAGAWNWRRMKPRLTGDNEISPMRSTASLELVLAAVVLGFTAVLVALELP